MLKYSVIIVNTNGENYLEKCLQSYVNQSPKPLEIIVIDNNSTDRSKTIISGFGNVTLIENTKNEGYPISLNKGIKAAKGDYIVLSNEDLYVSADWITHIANEFTKHVKCGLVASKVLYLEAPNIINSAGMLFYKDLSAVSRGLDEVDNGQYDIPEEIFGAYGAIMVFKKELFDQLGLFDEDYWLFREEDEFMWRMRKHGWVTRYAPQAKVFHKRSANTKLFSPFKLYYSERNRFWNVLKYMPLRCNLTMLPYVIYRYWMNFILAFRSNGSKKAKSLNKTPKLPLVLTIAKAWLHAFLGFPKMFRKRRFFNKGAVVSYEQCLNWVNQYEAKLEDIIK